MKREREPGEHEFAGSDWGTDHYLIAEYSILKLHTLQPPEVFFRLQLVLQIFRHHTRHADLDYWSGNDAGAYLSLVRMLDNLAVGLRDHKPASWPWCQALKNCQRVGLLLLSFLYDAHAWAIADPPDALTVNEVLFRSVS